MVAKTKYKPGLLKSSKFNPSSEVKSAAKYLAQRGLTGKKGDKLPVGMSVKAVEWINNNVTGFKRLVSMAKKDLIDRG